MMQVKCVTLCCHLTHDVTNDSVREVRFKETLHFLRCLFSPGASDKTLSQHYCSCSFTYLVIQAWKLQKSKSNNV